MATYYASSSASGGGAGTIGDEYTLQELLDNTDAGDIGLVKNDGTYTPSATVNVDNANAQTASNVATIRGCASDGTDDGTVATISGTSLGAGIDLLTIASSMAVVFENLRITAATDDNIYCPDAAYLHFNNCRIDNAAGYGFFTVSSSQANSFNFTNCEIDSNDSGIGATAGSRGGFGIYNSIIHDNTNYGLNDDGRYGKTTIFACAIYDNGSHGLYFRSSSQNPKIIGCVLFANGGNGIDFNSAVSGIVCYNTIFRSNGGYGIDTNSGSFTQFSYCDYNCYSNNTSGSIDINGGTPPGDNNVTSDPSFTNETDGSEDFTLQSGSPCINAGLDLRGY